MPRFFFAFWPDPEACEALAALARDVAGRCEGRPVPSAKIHLTLAFLGELDEGRVAAAAEAASRRGGAPFDLAFDRVGSFPRARVAWAGMSQRPPGLESWARGLSQELARAGFAVESRPFVPHLTIARHVALACPEEAISSIRWRARRFTLVESDLREGRYVVRNGWELEEMAR